MMDCLPDIILLKIFSYCTFRDRFILECVNGRINYLVSEVWNKKTIITIPDDLRLIQHDYPWSSYLDSFKGGVMRVLLDHCIHATKLYFKPKRHLQVFVQSTLFPYFQQFSNSIVEVHFGHLYVTDQHVIASVAEALPLLQKLTIQDPYPLLYRLRPDTIMVLNNVIRNLEPGLNELQDDNPRVHEDIRLCIELFTNLKSLTFRNICFEIVK